MQGGKRGGLLPLGSGIATFGVRTATFGVRNRYLWGPDCYLWGPGLLPLGSGIATFGVRIFLWNIFQVYDIKCFTKTVPASNFLTLFRQEQHQQGNVGGAFLKIYQWK
jgi:hypothetical protein